LQPSSLAEVIRSRFVLQVSSLPEVEVFPDESYSFCDCRGSEPKGSFDDARLAADVSVLSR
jgi:hypothetical protein